MRMSHLPLIVVVLAVACPVLCLEWWKTAIIYQIYPKSFKDSDGDGIGDLRGIIEKLDYLNDLGVSAIWISPIFRSPMADNGYDISDYRDIDPIFGTMEDFDELLETAHSKGIRVLLDYVPNHTSDEHEWFIASSDPTHENYTRYKDYYVWVDGTEDSLPNNWPGGFNEPSAWQWNQARQQHYLHQFHYKQPDLNYRNPVVLEEMKNVLRFWLDKGVDGFRMDAVICLVEAEGFPNITNGEPNPMVHQPETYAVVEEFRTVLDEYEEKVMVTEAGGTLDEVLGYYGNATNPGAHLSFNFLLITDLNGRSTAEEFVRVVSEWNDIVNERGIWSNWVLGNHDQHRVANRYSPELVDGMNMLVTLLPGTAVTYNGEEIGMEDNYNMTCEVAQDPQGCADNVTLGNSRDPERTPFQWDDSKNAGFSTADETWLPVNPNYLTLNAERQESAAGRSHLKTYRLLAQLRRDDESIHNRNVSVASAGSVFLFSRSQNGTATTVVALNVGSEEETVDIIESMADVDLPIILTVYASSVNSELDEGYRGKFVVGVQAVAADDVAGRSSAICRCRQPSAWRRQVQAAMGTEVSVTEKLDHLVEAGVTGVWLSPFFKSPMVDNGYDISDFTDVDPVFGTMEDFDELLSQAHAKGLKILMDFVPNHSSDEHEWFQKSSNISHPEYDKYEDYYVWLEGNVGEDGVTPEPPNNWANLFNGESAWEWNNDRQQYYLHQFHKAQPDLNYNNTEVVEGMKDFMRFWLEKGVDGFRMDAVPHLFEDGLFRDEEEVDGGLTSKYTKHQEGTYDMVRQWREVVQAFGTDKLMMTEAYGTYEEVVRYYGNDSSPGAHFSFNFVFITDVNNQSDAATFKSAVDDWLEVTVNQGLWSNWVIGNHDQPRVASRYSPELVDGMNMLVTLLPGTAVTYNGEEIGMEDNYNMTCEVAHDPQGCHDGVTLGRSRDPCRTPYQWDNTTSAGFSSNDTTWLPVHENYETLNLEEQKAADRSHFKVYQKLAAARKQRVVQRGATETFALGSVFAFTRTLAGEDSLLVAVNLGTENQSVDLKAMLPLAHHFTVLTSSVSSPLTEGSTVGSLTLGPHESVVLQASGERGAAGALRATALLCAALVAAVLAAGHC